MLWNHHHIRKTRNDVINYGRPSLMYEAPELFDTEDYIVPVHQNYIDVCQESDYCKVKSAYPCCEEMLNLCVISMEEKGYSAPTDADEAVTLYLDLRPVVRSALSEG